MLLNWSASGGLNAALGFYAPLTSSLVPVVSGGSATPTFTRATTAYVCDWEMVCRQVLSGEARFYGARRVQNLMVNSAMQGAPGNSALPTGWARVGNDATCNTLIADATPPDGAGRAMQMRMTAVGGFQGAGAAYTWALNALHVISVRVRVPTGLTASDCQLYLGTATPSSFLLASAATLNAQPKDVWVRYSVQATVTADTSHFAGFINPGQATGTGFDFTEPQIELVIGQSNQNPAEYVSTGFLTAPFHGAGVDGVQCFEYRNGNAVAANVVTAGVGAPIASTVLLGYQAEQQSTNLCLQSEDLTTTWAPSNATVTANSTVAPNGTTTADTIVATAASGSVSQSFTKAASALAYTLSTHFKPGTVNIVRLRLGDDNTFANGAAVEFNVATGVISTAAAALGAGWSGISATIKQVSSGYYRLTLTATSTALTTLAVSVGHNAAAVNTNSVIGWGHQLEQLAFATSYIPAVAATATRNADVLTYPTAGNVSDTAGTIYAELAFQGVTPPLTCIAVGFQSAGVGRGIYTNATSTQVRAFDGTTAAVSAVGASFQINVGKAASVWGGGFLTAYLAGGAGSAVGYDGTMAGAGPIGIGNAGDGLSSWNGTIRKVRIWKTALADSQLTALTA